MKHEIDCCEDFLPLKTEYGLCYSFNSRQASGLMSPKYMNNLETGPGSLLFHSTEDIQIHIHPPLEFPTYFSEGDIKETILWGTKKEVILNVMETYNEPGIEGVDPEIRNCRFAKEFGSEVDERFYYFYSSSACKTQCTIMTQLALCGCVPHFVFTSDNTSDSFLKTCDAQGLSCLDDKYQFLYDVRINCYCPISCEEPEYNIVYTSPEE